jgi:hypothetical protein
MHPNAKRPREKKVVLRQSKDVLWVQVNNKERVNGESRLHSAELAKAKAQVLAKAVFVCGTWRSSLSRERSG